MEHFCCLTIRLKTVESSPLMTCDSPDSGNEGCIINR